MDSACDVNIILIYANSNHARYKNRFLHKFTAGFELVNIEEYKHYRDILDKLKVMKKGVFYNKNEYVRTDFEDMTIAAEYLSFNYEKKKIDFFTTDNNMRKSLIIVSKELDIKVGKINCL